MSKVSGECLVPIGKSEYGIVYVSDGPFRGRVGYFEDWESVYSDDPDLDPALIGFSGWKELPPPDVGVRSLPLCLVIFGHPLLVKSYQLLPPEEIRHATTDDISRRQSQIFTTLISQRDLGEADLLDLMQELHLVDSVLIERILTARFISGSGKKLFVSHASYDKPFARKLCIDLVAAGHAPWLDEWAIRHGESIPKRINDGLKDSNYVLVVLSPAAVQSRWVETEWAASYWEEIQHGRVKLIPVLYKDCELPTLLQGKKYADFRGDYAEAFEALEQTLNLETSDTRPYGR